MAEETIVPNTQTEDNPDNYRVMSAEELIKVMKGEMLGVEGYEGFYRVIVGVACVIIDKVKVLEGVEINDKDVFPKPIKVAGGEFQRLFSVNGGEFQSWFLVNGGEFQRSFEVNGGKFQRSFEVNGGEFQSRFLVNGGEFQSWFEVNGGEFQRSFSINGGEFQSWFLVIGGEFQSRFLVNGGEFQSWFSINGGEFNNPIEIIGSSTYIKYLSLQSDHWPQLKIKGIKLDTLSFEGTYKTPNSIELVDLKLRSIQLTDFFNLSHFFLTNIQFEKPEEADSALQVHQSHLGHFECKNVHFEDFDHIDIRHSNLTGITLYDSDFPIAERRALSKWKQFLLVFAAQKSPLDRWKQVKKVFASSKFPIQTGKDNKKEHYRAVYEVYRDLTNAVSSQQDVSQKLRYFAAGQRALRKHLIQDRWHNWNSKITLSLSQFFSNYGQSWSRSALLTFLLGASLFSIYLASLGIKPQLIDFDGDYTAKVWSHFFYFLNPTHKYNFMAELSEEHGFWSSTIDFVSRILITLGAFEVIRSFRKYVRK